MITAAAISKTVFLLIMACNATDCPESTMPDSWSGPEAQSQCEAFIRSDDFDPSDYMELGGDETHYRVGCR